MNNFRVKYNKDIDFLNVKMERDYDFLEVLSLKIKQSDSYKLYNSNYGILVGRVEANDGFGIPNAKISIFIEKDSDETDYNSILYPYTSPLDKNSDGIKYNLLYENDDIKCHQNVGSFPSKKELLNTDIQETIYEKYYSFTTVTNESGDYMIFGIPTGTYQIHVDIDLSDIGKLSQTPRDLIYKGYTIDQFESATKFKTSTNLNSLSQLISEDSSVTIYPFWGDSANTDVAISRKDINIHYKFEPTCVFLGSIFTDSAKNYVSKSCSPSKESGKMSEMTTSEGSIEMLRETIDGKIEKYSIKGDRLINENGVWCYQIPMNLDYVITDEYGNIVPSNSPEIGMPTRANVRFRIKLDDNGDDFVTSKTAYYLIPNKTILNGSTTTDDYMFDDYDGVDVDSVSNINNFFVNLLWNNVYSIKNYIPRLQTSTNPRKRNFLGFKGVNYSGDNNPLPYNNISINLGLKFIINCLISSIILEAVGLINTLINFFASYHLFNNWHIFRDAINFKFIALPTTMIGDGFTQLNDITNYDYFIPFKKPSSAITVVDSVTANATKAKYNKIAGEDNIYSMTISFNENENLLDQIKDSMETDLAEDNEVINLDFTNDWVNGSLYAPKIQFKNKKKRNVLKTYYCSKDKTFTKTRLMQSCSVGVNLNTGVYTDTPTTNTNYLKDKMFLNNNTTMLGVGNVKNITENDENIFYYTPTIYNNSKLKYLHTTGVILLGSLMEDSMDGIPQLHRYLSETSFKLPPSLFESEINAENSTETNYIISLSNLKYFETITNISNVSIGDLIFLTQESEYVTLNPDTNLYGSEVYLPVNIITTLLLPLNENEVYILTSSQTQTDLGSYINEGRFNNTQGDDYLFGSYNISTIITNIILDTTEPTIGGIDWGGTYNYKSTPTTYTDNHDVDKQRKGLLVGIKCTSSETIPKTCINASRLCEIGVNLDEKDDEVLTDELASENYVDGYISIKEVNDSDVRAMFATLNYNNLQTYSDTNYLNHKKYTFTYLSPLAFDGKLKAVTDNSNLLTQTTADMTSDYTNTNRPDYLKFRLGVDNISNLYDYSGTYNFIRYENSFYFYFGLKHGKTAIDLLNSQYFASCD